MVSLKDMSEEDKREYKKIYYKSYRMRKNGEFYSDSMNYCKLTKDEQRSLLIKSICGGSASIRR
jgi:hypothetical protein